jgi:hypothetical protein
MYYDGEVRRPIPPVLGMNLGPLTGGAEVTLYVKALCSFGGNKHDVRSRYSNGSCKSFECINAPRCKWELWTRKQADLNWKITKLCDEHDGTCVSMASPSANLLRAMISSTVIPEKRKDKQVRVKTVLEHVREVDGHLLGETKCDGVVVDDLGEEHEVSENTKRDAGYYRVYRQLRVLKQAAIESFDEGFSHLEEYVAALNAANPGSTITLQFTERATPTESDPNCTTKTFVRLFVMLRGQAECAARGKPVISYDGAFTKVIRLQQICLFRITYIFIP